MYGKTSPKIKPKRQPPSRPKESVSESSFLSDSFCFKVLGKPCLSIQKTEGCKGDFNTPKINKKYKIPKQQFAVYHLMEELNIKHPATADQRFSEENMKETSLGSYQQIKRNSVGSRNSVIEQERSNQRIDSEQELSASQATYITPSQNFRQSQTEETVSKNSKDSAAYRYSSEIKSNQFEVKSKISPNDVRTQDQRLSPIISREISNPRSSLKIYTADEPVRYSIPNNEPPRLTGCRNYLNDDNNYDSKFSKIREDPKRDVAPCFCETDSQTSYPSILKQNRRSISSNIDKYPVKECSWRGLKQKFVDKMQQTSENRFVSNSHTTGPLIDTSVNTLNAETASVQITELSSTKVQTTDSSTPEEVCFRPIQNFCKCKDPPSYFGSRYMKRDQKSAADRLVSIDTNVTVPSPKPPVFRKPPKAVVTSPTEMSKRGQGRVRHRYSFGRGGAPVFTETSDEQIYFQEDEIDDSYGECQSDYGEVDRYQRYRRNKYYPTREECYRPSDEGCRCCQNRKIIASTATRRAVPYRPPPPPIDYELTSSEDDIELSFDENDDSDDPFFDQSENRATRYKGLPYQNNGQYIDLVQELEETLQSRNKTRVQRAMNEFEYKSRLNEPLERPIIDYEEPSDSEEAIIKKISDLAEKRKYNHKKFPCKGKACCNCILKNDMKDNRPKLVVKSAGPKKKTKWQLNKQTGEWLKVSSGSDKRDHECGCTCACGRQVK